MLRLWISSVEFSCICFRIAWPFGGEPTGTQRRKHGGVRMSSPWFLLPGKKTVFHDLRPWFCQAAFSQNIIHCRSISTPSILLDSSSLRTVGHILMFLPGSALQFLLFLYCALSFSIAPLN